MGEHEMKCNNCGQIMDLRDLSQVFAHEECNGVPINYADMRRVEHIKGVKVPRAPEFNSPKFMEGYDKLLLFSQN